MGDKRRFPLNASDIGLGLASIPVVFVLAMLTGGFTFWTPWLLWCSLVLFGCGWMFAHRPADHTWRKVVGINLSWLLGIPIVVRGPWWLITLVGLGTLAVRGESK